MDYNKFCKRCKNYEFNFQKGILCSLTLEKPLFTGECKDFILDPERDKKTSNSNQKFQAAHQNKTASVLEEDFKKSAIGNLILSVIISLVLFFVIVSQGNFETSLLQTGSFFILYNLFSWLLYGYLAFSRKQLKGEATKFIIATIIITAGGWWLGHVLAFINVKIGLEVYNILFANGKSKKKQL